MKRRLRKCFAIPLQVITAVEGLFLASIYDFEFEAIPMLIAVLVSFVINVYIIDNYTTFPSICGADKIKKRGE